MALFLGNPAEDKLPKDATAGRILSGSVSLGTLASSPGKESPDTLALSFVVPPPKSDVDKGKGNAPENGNGKKDAADVDADLEKAVLAAQVAFLKACNWLLVLFGKGGWVGRDVQHDDCGVCVTTCRPFHFIDSSPSQ